MRTVIFLVVFLFCGRVSLGQSKKLEAKADTIVAEAKELYKSEMASWYDTDIFLASYNDKSKIGGYFSYTEGLNSKCVFYSINEPVKVIGTIIFDSTFNTLNAISDITERSFTDLEKELYVIRKTAKDLVAIDTFFRSYKNTNFNLIPLIHGNDKKVYILTGTLRNDVVIFGNDYLLHFNKQNEISEKRRLHVSMLEISYGEKQQNEVQGEALGSAHTHLAETGDFITPTDICTLMLYQPFTKWKSHVVVSKDYFNFWNCDEQKLTIMPSKDIPKEYKQSE